MGLARCFGFTLAVAACSYGDGAAPGADAPHAGGDAHGGSEVDAMPDGPPAMCASPGAPGEEAWRTALGAGALALTSTVAVDGQGNVAVTKERQQLVPLFGTFEYAGDGALLYGHPFGVLVAQDAAGNAYVATPFDEPIDVGFGPMQPTSVADVFLAKLDPAGAIVFARPLHLLTSQLLGIAVAADGRIAVSDRGFGTVVLDASARVLWQQPVAGDVAFDSAGTLVIGGAFTGALCLGSGVTLATPGDEDGFVVAYDCDGRYLWSAQITDPPLPYTLLGQGGEVTTRTRQAVTAVAITPANDVVIAGEFPYGADVLGDILVSPVAIAEIGLLESGFVAALDAGTKRWTTKLSFVEAVTDAAIGPSGAIFVTGSRHTEIAPSTRAPMLVELSPTGTLLYEDQMNVEGAGHAIDVDACGDVYQTFSYQPGPDFPERVAVLRKLAF